MSEAQPRKVEHVLAPDELAASLLDLPHWSLSGSAIERRIRTASFKATLMVVTTVGHLCEIAWHHPRMTISFNAVVVRLWTHTVDAVTAKDIELARKIDAVIDWDPGREGGALTGLPIDPRHAYIRRD